MNQPSNTQKPIEQMTEQELIDFINLIESEIGKLSETAKQEFLDLNEGKIDELSEATKKELSELSDLYEEETRKQEIKSGVQKHNDALLWINAQNKKRLDNARKYGKIAERATDKFNKNNIPE